jgi:hypothetical protein
MTFGRRHGSLGVQASHKENEDRVCHSEPQRSEGGVP